MRERVSFFWGPKENGDAHPLPADDAALYIRRRVDGGLHFACRVGVLTAMNARRRGRKMKFADSDPGQVLPGVKSIIGLLSGYESGTEIPEEGNYVISRYARGKDYHMRIRRMLDHLTSALKAQFGEARHQSFVDSGVMHEKAWAELCGLGWRGKNTLLIHPRHGSWFFIGLILTQVEAAPDTPGQDHCGTCERCIRACPTGALIRPHVLDPLKCIAYQTIENKGAISPALRTAVGEWIFGCDVCQDVCPFNRFAKETRWPEFKAEAGAGPRLDLIEVLSIASDQEFRNRFRGTPLTRPKRRGLLRNAAVQQVSRSAIFRF